MPKTCLMIVAGERSGDVYGAALAGESQARTGVVGVFRCGGGFTPHGPLDQGISAGAFLPRTGRQKEFQEDVGVNEQSHLPSVLHCASWCCRSTEVY